MRFLIDQNIGYQAAQELNRLGHDAVHVRDLGLMSADDADLIKLARREERVIVSVDSDFEKSAARTQSINPSVIRVRYAGDARLQNPANVASRVHEISQRDAAAMQQGSITHVRKDDYAIAPLPLRDTREIDRAPAKRWRGDVAPARTRSATEHSEKQVKDQERSKGFTDERHKSRDRRRER